MDENEDEDLSSVKGAAEPEESQLQDDSQII